MYTRVFGRTSEGGNPCPVVLNADALSTAQMQAMAAAFGCETAFVVAPQSADAALRLRYFVPLHEMEMCVHATVGALTVLVEQRHITKSLVQVETPLGVLPLEWRREDGQLWVTVEQFPPTFFERQPGRQPIKEEVAAVLGVDAQVIDERVGPIQNVSVSRSKMMIPLQDVVTLDSLQPSQEQVRQLCERYATTGLYPFTLRTRSPQLQAEARQFPKNAGYLEDPATGVAAAALAAYLIHAGANAPSEHGWQVLSVGQGDAMGQPSLMRAEVLVEGGMITRTRITGQARILSEEQRTIPAANS
jgi:PhzF family phenazine biosynthesis protein